MDWSQINGAPYPYAQGYPPALLVQHPADLAGISPPPLQDSPHPHPHRQLPPHRHLQQHAYHSPHLVGQHRALYQNSPDLRALLTSSPALASSPPTPAFAAPNLRSSPPRPSYTHSPSPTPYNRTASMQSNNPQQQGQQPPPQIPGQINMNALVRAQHIQNLPNLSIQQKNSLVSAVSQCSAMVQNSAPGSQEHTRALMQWQNITQKYVQARNAAQRSAQQNAGGQGGAGAGAGGAQNMGVPQQPQGGGMGMQQQSGGAQAMAQNQGGQFKQPMPQGQGQQGGSGGGMQAAAGQQKPMQTQGQTQAQAQAQAQAEAAAAAQIPKQIMDYVNNYTYYHPNGIGPGHLKYEEYRADVKLKHAKILFDNERNKKDLRDIKKNIEDRKAAGQEIPQNLEEMRVRVEQKTNDLGQQLAKWTQNQKVFKEKYEQQRAAAAAGGGTPGSGGQSGGPSADGSAPGGSDPQIGMGSGSGPGGAGSPVNGGPQQGNRPSAMSPGVPTSANQQPNTANNFPQQQQPITSGQSQATPQSATAPPQPQQRPSISAGVPQQPPPMPNMQQAQSQSSQQSGNPTPLTHQQAVQRAYSGGTPQSAGGPGTQQPHPAAHSQPYAGGQAPPRETSTTSSSNMNPSAKLMTSKTISPSLSQPPVPVQNFPQSRPTMAGPANGVGGIMGQPAIAKPTFSLESTESGGVLSKKKLDELVRQVTGGGEGMGGEMLTPEVEEAILMMADEFVDNVITASCKLAKLRDSSTLDVRDIQLILERNYNIRVPGYASDELRAIRKFAPAPGWTAKMNAIQAAKVMGGKNET